MDGYKTYEKLKPSGVAWLGDIPEHWVVKKIKYTQQFLNNRRIPLSTEERASMEKIFDYYGASGIIDKVENYIFNEKTILIAEDGANLLSKSTPLAFVAEGKYWVNNHAHIIKPISGNFLYWKNVLCEIDYTPYISGSAQPKLTKEAIAQIETVFPTLPEQQAIADFLDRKTQQIDELIAKKERFIELLQEKRIALITAAVTGKVTSPDVRKLMLANQEYNPSPSPDREGFESPDGNLSSPLKPSLKGEGGAENTQIVDKHFVAPDEVFTGEGGQTHTNTESRNSGAPDGVFTQTASSHYALIENETRSSRVSSDTPYIPYETRLTEFARANRKHPTPAEEKVWAWLRSKQFFGFKFRRQKPIYKFIADFYCPELLLVIEIDGNYHDQQQDYDELRTDILENDFGMLVVRFTNHQVLNQFSLVEQTLQNKLLTRQQTLTEISPPKPSLTGEGGAENTQMEDKHFVAPDGVLTTDGFRY